MNPPVDTRHTGESPICEICKSGKQEPFCIGCERLQEHDAAIREDERNRVITAFIEKGYTRIETVAPLEGIHLGWVLLSDVRSCLESLRATTPGNQIEPEKDDE